MGSSPHGARRLTTLVPVLAGVAVAGTQIVAGVDTEGTAITVTAAASCYLAAAVFGARWFAWAGVLLSVLVVTVSELAGIPWWAGLSGYAVVLVALGGLRPAGRRVLADQGLAMAGFGGVAIAALFVSPRLGLGLAGLALAGHAVWDYRHWRRDDVVPRAMAEACWGLDVPLGLAAVIVAWQG